MSRPRLRLFGLAMLGALALAGCDSKAERAEAYRQRAAAYLAEGEPERASIELRNALRLDPDNVAARLDYARLLRDQGDVGGAYRQYAALVAADRNNLDGQREFAALALQVQDFAAAVSAANRAYELAPGDTGVRALKAALDFRGAQEGEAGNAARAEALAMARAVVAEDPTQVPAQMTLIAERMQAGDAAAARALADAALAASPSDEGLHLVRLAALESLGDIEGMDAGLARMAELFPDNPGVSQAQVRLRMYVGDAAGAEAVLRARAEAVRAKKPEDPEADLAVAAFLYQTQGLDAARAELDRLAAAAPSPLPYKRTLAGLDFSEGRRDEAIATLRALTKGAAPSGEIRDTEVDLAAMLAATGDTAGRDALLASVLEADRRHVGALKLRARAAIAADQPERAIQDMRTALTQAPRDPEVMTILAEAHLREGARELAGERFALAVEASNRAPAESLRYAGFLMEDGKAAQAEEVVGDALRLAPADADLLAALGELQVARRDWSGLGQTVGLLRGAGTEAGTRAAERLETARAAGEGRPEEALALLRGRAEAGDSTAAGQYVEALAATGDIAGAQAWVAERLSAAPEDRRLRMMDAGLLAASGRLDEAEAAYRAMAAADPSRPEAWRALFGLLAAQGETQKAEAALVEGRAATGEDAELLFLAAGTAENRGDIEEAIALYETLYARDSGNAVVANNLASLLSTSRADPESLERAFVVARRLRGSDSPYFQDTYGWILHRRGDSAQALPLLEQAAATLPGNAQVQGHRAEALLALGRRPEARAAFEEVAALAPGSPEAEAARARIAEIDAPVPAPAQAAQSDG